MVNDTAHITPVTNSSDKRLLTEDWFGHSGIICLFRLDKLEIFILISHLPIFIM